MPNPYRVLVTGSRDWTDPHTVYAALDSIVHEVAPRHVTIVHGACPTGADQHAHAWIMRHCPPDAWDRLCEEPHPADWELHGRRAGPIRNAHMVSLGADLCLAFVKANSRGAAHCSGLAEKAGIPVRRWTA